MTKEIQRTTMDNCFFLTWILQADSGQTKLVSKSLSKLRPKSFLQNRISFQGAYSSKV
jgi:hypothetical protein